MKSERIEALISTSPYDALQQYKALFHRTFSKGNESDALALIEGACAAMIKSSQIDCARDLALMLVDDFNTNKLEITPARTAAIDRIAALFPENCKQLLGIMKSAIKWSPDNPSFHTLLGGCLWSQEDHLAAQLHYVRGDVSVFAPKLISWAKQGLSSELDLFLARAIFQCLAFKKIDNARLIFQLSTVTIYPGIGGSVDNCGHLPSPLMNFCRFLILVCGSSAAAAPLFQTLTNRYAVSLGRDPNFSKYVDHIGKVYFNIRASGNIFEDLLHGFLGGGGNM